MYVIRYVGRTAMEGTAVDIKARVVKTARFFKPANREEKDRITG